MSKVGEELVQIAGSRKPEGSECRSMEGFLVSLYLAVRKGAQSF